MSTDICRWLFLLISLSTWITLTSSKETRVVCYYTNWSVYRPGTAKFSPQNINPYLCTHLIYAFGGFTKENTLKPFDKYQDIEKGGYAKFTGLKTYNKNLKTMLAIGGWNEGSSRFSPMVASPERRKELVKNSVKFLRQNHFDGLDLDWEYPTFRDGGKSRDRDNYAQLVKELREEFERESEKTGRPRLLLTMAVPAGIEYINKGYDVPKLTKYLDWMNILSYDYHSAFEPSVNHHAPLYPLEEDNEYNYDVDLNIDHTIKHYLEKGADPNKLVLGIPTYGRSYTLFNPDAFELGAPADGPGDMGDATRENGYLAYYEICEYVKDQDWEVEQPNEDAMGPYAFKDNQWVGYDDEKIVRKKSQYVAKNNLGGIMFWAIDNDDFRGTCHGRPYPLIEAAKEALLEAYGITDDNLIAPTPKPIKSKTRTRTKVATKDESDNQVSTSSGGSSRRRNRVKSKSESSSSSTRDSSSDRQKSRRKQHKTTEGTSTYSSLKVVTPSYTTPAPPSTPDQGGAFKCEDEGFFPHPKDCKKYFWCLSGAGDSGIIAHQFTCPAGLYFNKAADSCDYTQNVLCNKKLSRTTAAEKESTSAGTSTTSKPTLSTLFSTTRAPPKITAATSKTTYSFRTTEPSVEEEYDDEEYEDDEEEVGNRKVDSEEDPRVIKELIELIKKAGGIEELEKRLSGDTSSSGPDSTTPTTISKSLVARVLGQTGRNKITKANTFSFLNKNSRGSQTEGITKTEEKSVKTKVDRGRPQYTSISRQRPSTSKPDEDEEDDEDNESVEVVEKTEEKSKLFRTFKKTSTPEYVNIRRAKVSSTEEPDGDISSRNKILGEGEEDDEEDDVEEDGKTREVKTNKNIPQYVNIRRQRPSTTEEPTTSKYKEIRRGTTPQSTTEETNETTTSKYKTIRRGFSNTTTSDAEDEDVSSKYKSIRRGTTTAATTTVTETEDVSSKYKTVRRGSTTVANVTEDASKRRTFTAEGTISTTTESLNFRRRGSTTESAASTEADALNSKRRGTTVDTTISTEADNSNLRYKTLRRGSTTTPTSVAETDAGTSKVAQRGTTTESTTASIDENEVTIKNLRESTTSVDSENDINSIYSIRGTTISNINNEENDVTNRIKLQESLTELPVEEPTTILEDQTKSKLVTGSTTQIQDETTASETATQFPKTTAPVSTLNTDTSKLLTLEITTNSNVPSGFTAAVSKTAGKEVKTGLQDRRTLPTLLEPRPFSIARGTSLKPKPESTTQTAKIGRPTAPTRLFRVGGRRKTTTTRPAATVTTTPANVQRTTKLTRRKFPPQTAKPLESQETTTTISTTKTDNRFRFISRKPFRLQTNKKKLNAIEDNVDQTIESSNQQSLEEDIGGGETTELGDIAVALHDIQQAPIPSTTTTTTRKPTKIVYNFPSTINQNLVTKAPARLRTRYSTTSTPIAFTTAKYVVKKRRPQAFDKINPSDANTFKPLSSYDYYDDGILSKIPEHSKVLLHSNGVIECLDQGNFPHPVSCKKFISCAKMENGKVLGWEYTCPKNLSFDPIGGICNWSAGLGCHEQ